ncbi:MAG: DNA-binding protein [Planctomycetota bacterium]|nr:MAG: DNA-binding protein [Planctomycetota bacterium]
MSHRITLPNLTVDAPLLLDSREAARRLGISARTLWTLTDEGRVKAVRINRLVKYDPRDLLAFIDSAKS